MIRFILVAALSVLAVDMYGSEASPDLKELLGGPFSDLFAAYEKGELDRFIAIFNKKEKGSYFIKSTTCDSLGDTLFHCAIKRGDVGFLEWLREAMDRRNGHHAAKPAQLVAYRQRWIRESSNVKKPELHSPDLLKKIDHLWSELTTYWGQPDNEGCSDRRSLDALARAIAWAYASRQQQKVTVVAMARDMRSIADIPSPTPVGSRIKVDFIIKRKLLAAGILFQYIVAMDECVSQKRIDFVRSLLTEPGFNMTSTHIQGIMAYLNSIPCVATSIINFRGQKIGDLKDYQVRYLLLCKVLYQLERYFSEQYDKGVFGRTTKLEVLHNMLQYYHVVSLFFLKKACGVGLEGDEFPCIVRGSSFNVGIYEHFNCLHTVIKQNTEFDTYYKEYPKRGTTEQTDIRRRADELFMMMPISFVDPL